MPKLFSLFPYAANHIHQFFCDNIGHVTVEKCKEFIEHSLFATIANTENKSIDDPNDRQTKASIKTSIGLTSVSLSTVYKYLRHLGYKHDQQKRIYLSDGHERPEQKAARTEFIQEYFAREKQSYVGAQISERDALQLESDPISPLLKDIAFENTDEYGTKMREYHIDCHPKLANYIDESNVQYGGNLSVRRDHGKRPLIIIGPDESAFAQQSFSSKTWVGPNGERKLLPKGEGDTIMVSAFQSAFSGWDWT
jgi:hypothetical protein